MMQEYQRMISYSWDFAATHLKENLRIYKTLLDTTLTDTMK